MASKVSQLGTLVGQFLAAASLAAAGDGHPIAVQPLAAISTTATRETTDRAVLHALKVRLPDGQGLARTMIELGVRQSDAALAAKLAAGHLGAGAGGCQAKLEFSAPMDGGAYELHRVVVLTASSETTIERRGGTLVISAQQLTNKSSRLV